MNYCFSIYNTDTLDRERWNRLANECDYSTPFSIFEYYHVFNPEDVSFIVALEKTSGRYLAGIPFRIKGRLPLLGNTLATVIAETSVLTAAEITDDNEIHDLRLDTYREMIFWCRKINAVQVMLNHWSRETDRILLEKLGLNVLINSTFEISAGLSYPEIYINYQTRCRNTIRKALSRNVDIKIHSSNFPEDAAEICGRLSEITFKRALVSNRKSSMQLKTRVFFKSLLDKFSNNIILGIAYDAVGTPVSFAIILFNKHTAVYYRGGSDVDRNRELGASNLLLDRILETSKRMNITVFDFGGVPVNPGVNHPAWGVYKFKESFGGARTTYCSGNKVLSPSRFFIMERILRSRLLMRGYSLIRPIN